MMVPHVDSLLRDTELLASQIYKAPRTRGFVISCGEVR
jgi:hypothetical protein